MLEFIILEDGRQEEFMRCWYETKTEMLSAEKTTRGWESLGPKASTPTPNQGAAKKRGRAEGSQGTTKGGAGSGKNDDRHREQRGLAGLRIK